MTKAIVGRGLLVPPYGLSQRNPHDHRRNPAGCRRADGEGDHGLKHSLAGIRTGRANPGLVDSLRVDVYGSAVPIKQVASVGAPEPNQIVIRPYDPGTIKDIEKAIQVSDLGFNPQSDGRVIRLNVPPLSTEVRRKMVARIKDLTEEAKVAIRNVRRDGNKMADQARRTRISRRTSATRSRRKSRS